MNVLLLTPMYRIVGRDSLPRDNEAIHNLVKYWSKNHDMGLQVINTYLIPARKAGFLLKKGRLKDFFSDYTYVTDGVEVHLIEIQQLPFQKRFGLIQKKRIMKIINSISTKFQPDILLTHFPTRYLGTISQIRMDVPRIGVLHYTDLNAIQKHPEFVEELNKQYDVLFARSYSLRDMVRNKGVKIQDFVVSSGVPCVDNSRKRTWDFENRKIEILSVGRLMKRKHLDYVIKALAIYKGIVDFHLTIIGEGDEDKKLRNLGYKLGIAEDLDFLGVIPREQVYSQMEQADIFIMPSIKETLGLVYIEAMMNGCITVGTKHEGIDGIIQNNKNGFLVEPNDLHSVEITIGKIFSMNASDLGLMSQKAKETAHLYTEEGVSAGYLDKLKEIIAEWKRLDC